MRRLPIVYLVLGLLIPLTSLGQRISNPTDLIKKNNVKKVFIFRTKLSDTSDNNRESLALTLSYDTIGRRIATEEYFRGKLTATQYYHYDSGSFTCLSAVWISATGELIDSNKVLKGGNVILDCQQEFYGNSPKYITSYTSTGLISVIIDYSKIIHEKRTPGNTYKNGKLTDDYMTRINTEEPESIFRLEYLFY